MINAIGKVAFAFIIVCFSAQYWSFLPSVKQIVLTIIASVVVIAFNILANRPQTLSVGINIFPYLIGGLAGIIWGASVGHSYLSWQLPSDKFQQTVIVQAEILSVTENQRAQKLDLRVRQLDNESVNFKAKVQAYYFTKTFQKHQLVQLCLKLKPSHGLQNPGGFGYWRWLVSKQMKATGYVRKCQQNKLLSPSASIATILKYRLSSIEPKAEKWIKAMLLAEREDLTSEDWDLLQRTGVAHLFTLSGLHMGVVFILCVWLAKLLLFAAYSLIGKQTDPVFTIGVQGLALSSSWIFVAICDFPLTLVRACLALTLFVILRASHRYSTLVTGVKWVLVVCLLFDPFSIFGISVYLSFFAVLVLVFLSWRFSFGVNSFFQRAQSALCLQLFLTLFMMIATGIIFGAIHWSSFFINLIAIPLVTLVVVPLGCLCTLLLLLTPSLAEAPISLLGDILYYFVETLHVFPTLSTHLEWPKSYWLLALVLLALCFIPSIRFRTFLPLFVLIIGGVVVSNCLNKKPDWSIHIFDVGQGSALLIQSENQAMLVDTGGGYDPHRPLAASVIAPSLKTLGIRLPIEGVISHFDTDHSAGQAWLTDNEVVAQWHSIYTDCLKGQQWQLGKLTIKVLWPSEKAVHKAELSKNNLSCVLFVTDGVVSALIPGDIEKEAESAMLLENKNVDANILVAPHHGSKSSSTAAWLSAVSPDYVVVQNGFLNRWRLPHKNVLNSYREQHAQVYTTAKDGYIRFDVNTNAPRKRRVQVKTWFTDFQKRWYKTFHTH
jgi:competence protein ComEC